MASSQSLSRVRKEIIESGIDTRYHPGAYEFVLNGLDFYLTTIGEKRHVTGKELSVGLLNFAFKQFGIMSLSVLNYWGINATGDFGCIVFNMIEIGLMSKQPEDSVEDFSTVEEMDTFFNKQTFYEIDKTFIKKIKGA
jgi:uncharacterized repeat protein (TIGR04138 family)